MRNAPPGIARPTDSGWASVSAADEIAIRAVASVWPYITTKSQPACCPRPAYRRTAARVHPPARLRDEAERRRAEHIGADPIDHLERVGHAGERRHPPSLDRIPEARVDDRRVGHDDRAPGREVRGDDREPVAVVQRERGHRSIAVGQAERLADGQRVGQHGVVREPHELRSAGRSRRAHQHGEFRVQLVREGSAQPGPMLDSNVAAASGHDGVRTEALGDLGRRFARLRRRSVDARRRAPPTASRSLRRRRRRPSGPSRGVRPSAARRTSMRSASSAHVTRRPISARRHRWCGRSTISADRSPRATEPCGRQHLRSGRSGPPRRRRSEVGHGRAR